ncbi:DUF3467 domain-containing protein [Candidatus Auribacterota bacterium]
MPEPKKKEQAWEVSPEKENGTYSNVARIQSSAFDFIIDFGRQIPDTEKVKLESRIVLTPEHAGAFLSALQKHYTEYQKHKKDQQTPPSGWYFDDFRFKR